MSSLRLSRSIWRATAAATLADELGSALVQAVLRGVANEPVSVGTGDGASLGRAASTSWYAFAVTHRCGEAPTFGFHPLAE